MTDDTIPTGEETTVPIGELEELVAKWRRVEDVPNPDELCERNKGVYNATLSHADELQDLINEHDPKQ